MATNKESEDFGIINQSIKIKNYKCFIGEEPQGFEEIYPINIIIGKNNSGKSSLIDLISFIGNIETMKNKRGNQEAIALFVQRKLNNKNVTVLENAHFELGNNRFKFTETTIVKYSLAISKNGGLPYDIEIDNIPIPASNDYTSIVFELANDIFKNKDIVQVKAERDIVSESPTVDSITVNPNGALATNALREIINANEYDADIVNVVLLEAINRIVKPDIEFKQIYVEHKEGIANWEIYFKDLQGNKIPLSEMGSGIKTILLVLINLEVIPEAKKERSNLIFCFEELENNLHPALQRRLFNYILDYSIKNKAYFFITTHSNVVIDLFSKNPRVQIVHVINKGVQATVETVISQEGNRKILKDLDYRASDLLMSNGIIWVKGPSDAIYIEMLLDLYKKKIGKEGETNLSYTIQVLATAIWKYAGFDGVKWDNVEAGKDLENKVIALEKLNHNHLLIIDKDKDYELDKKPSQFGEFDNGTGKNKARLINESLKFGGHNEDDLESKFDGNAKVDKKKILFFWINGGTMETYLEKFITGKEEFEKYFKKDGYFRKKEKKDGEDYSISKVELAGKIADYVRDENLVFDDIAEREAALANKIIRLYNTIKM